jgi:hypothetical protein
MEMVFGSIAMVNRTMMISTPVAVGAKFQKACRCDKIHSLLGRGIHEPFFIKRGLVLPVLHENVRAFLTEFIGFF